MPLEVCYSLPAVATSFAWSSAWETCHTALTAPFDSASLFISPMTYLKIFSLTCLLEFPVYFLALKDFMPKAGPIRQLWRVIWLNLATHPLVTFGLGSFAISLGWSLRQYLALGEGIAIGLEILLVLEIWRVSAKRAVATALVANLVSWNFGLFLWSL